MNWMKMRMKIYVWSKLCLLFQVLGGFEISVLERPLKSCNIELGKYLDERLSFKCCLRSAANP